MHSNEGTLLLGASCCLWTYFFQSADKLHSPGRAPRAWFSRRRSSAPLLRRLEALLGMLIQVTAHLKDIWTLFSAQSSWKTLHYTLLCNSIWPPRLFAIQFWLTSPWCVFSFFLIVRGQTVGDRFKGICICPKACFSFLRLYALSICRLCSRKMKDASRSNPGSWPSPRQ